jgi:hypothetical protein
MPGLSSTGNELAMCAIGIQQVISRLEGGLMRQKRSVYCKSTSQAAQDHRGMRRGHRHGCIENVRESGEVRGERVEMLG